MQRRAFNPKTFLSSVGVGRKMVSSRKGQIIYAQGDPSEFLFVIQTGNVKLSVKSRAGKKAILEILGNGDFIFIDSVAGQSSRTASASAMTDCTLLRIEKKVMMRALIRRVNLANIFRAYLLARNIRYEQDLVDQRRNLGEKRLARILLSLTHFDGHGAPETTIPSLSHQTLAEMVGTTRARIRFS
jgi:CRP/FNR family transcriptional regulator, cyclic AMP receptor protein